MSVGGPVESISLDGREFAVAADADTQRKLGGFENEYQPNGNGTARMVKTRVPWSLTGVNIDLDDDRDDHRFLQNLADGSRDFPIAITYASSAVFQGVGNITGEVQYNNTNSTAALNLGGPQKLTKQ